ncbi:MAG: hypothetical protein KBS84_10160 [Treponema sp.]|nr:hypothetical protein [Candidatus Treponema scatequi]
MYNDVEADFWKELFVHVQHKNMVRIGAEKLTFSQCKPVIDDFISQHPEYKIDTDYSSSYCTFEVFVTQTIKLRLFIQASIKATLLQFDGGDYVKIADAKFAYNPFPEIEEFLSHSKDYTAELNSIKTKELHTKAQLKTAREFIKARCRLDYDPKNIVWNLSDDNAGFKLSLIDGKEKKEVHLDIDDFESQMPKYNQ